MYTFGLNDASQLGHSQKDSTVQVCIQQGVTASVLARVQALRLPSQFILIQIMHLLEVCSQE